MASTGESVRWGWFSRAAGKPARSPAQPAGRDAVLIPQPKHGTDMSTEQGGREDPLRRRAYQLWKEDGMREGEDLRYWLEAEKQEAAVRVRRRAEADANLPASHVEAEPRSDGGRRTIAPV
jgi:hypothetical protein